MSGLAEICHVFEPPLQPARLIRRYKRFLADVRMPDGTIETVHCPNSGSMLGCLEADAPVMLSPAAGKARRTRFTWEMIHLGGGWIGLNTILPNKLMAEAARQRALPLFAEAVRVRPEVKVSAHTRLDLLVETAQGPLYAEMKNVSLALDGRALFPDARTERGAKHLHELMRLKAEGALTAVIFVVQRSDAASFAPAEDIDPVYAATLRQAGAAGVAVVAVQAEVTPRAVCLCRRLPVVL